MQKHLISVTDQKGNAVPTYRVTVFDHGTANLATLYSDDGVTGLSNPFDVNDPDGTTAFYAANGRYDYTITNGPAGMTNETVEDVLLFDPVNSSPETGLWKVKSANYTAVSGDHILVDSSAAPVTITLPASPGVGDRVVLVDAEGTTETNTITVGRNGEKIQGAASDLTLDLNTAAAELVYYNAARGWVLIQR